MIIVIVPSGLQKADLADYDALLAEAAGVAALPNPLFATLTNKERIILEAMRRAMPEPLPLATMLLLFSDNWHLAQKVTSHTLPTHLYRLRKHIQEAKAPLRIITYRENAQFPPKRPGGGGTAYLLVSTAVAAGAMLEAAE